MAAPARPDTAVTGDSTRWWAEALTVRPAGRDTFEAGPAPAAFPRLYGGQIAAQGLVAAASTVAGDREPHATHTAFLRGGDITLPVVYRVERVRESRTFSTRLVRAEQEGRLLATATASFRLDDGAAPDLEHDIGPDGSAPVPPPESLPTRPERLTAAFGDDVPEAGAPVWPVDVRHVDRAPWDPPQDRDGDRPRSRIWIRGLGTLPDVPAAHAAALTFATDHPMFEPILFPHDVDWRDLVTGRSLYGTSLDHALWFHRPPRFDGWLLLDQVAPVAGRSRGYCRAGVRTADGATTASVAQEVVFVSPRP